ncbi:ABC transporter ATP-binding protein [Gilvimarinus polysaccharolyticus]|uniref:ABC transporter ATP-binding protein n=1 Tax=Gilvimarinus polysaccharolyticus TaxID=863921 RepID=UPI0006738F50|nr:ABC transporter ATP-binding protein [Gilvimarinus polysaccharolyticus]
MNSVLTVNSVSKKYLLIDQPFKRLLSLLVPTYNRTAQVFCALDNVSVSLDAGETLGIVGRNGAGKSTLLQIICGTLKPSEGYVDVRGRVAALLELGAGFNPDFTGRENIYLNAAIYGLTRREVDARIENMIAFAEIGEFIDRPVRVYSSGMFVRLAFSIIAHVDADVLVIDEALAVGDALFSQKCMRFLAEFKKTGSIIFVSHDSGAVSQLCDKALWLHEGKVMLEGSAKQVTETYLEFLYGEIQGDIKVDSVDVVEYEQALEAWYDPREELLKSTKYRNDIEIAPFDTAAESFGTGQVKVADTCLRDEHGRKLSVVFGGAVVELEVVMSVQADLNNFIVGFLLKDKRGQVLFGDNSLLFKPDGYSVSGDNRYVAKLKFLMPYLAQGEYVISLGIASGTQSNHVQHCWIHDALVFSCQSSHIIHGLFGTPVVGFTLDVVN